MRYTGIDVSSRMIEEGRRVHPRLDLRQGNVLDRSLGGVYDAVLAQGIFYRLGPEAERLSFQLIKKMFSKARRVAAFCAISTWADRKNEQEFYVDPVWLIAQCRRLTRFLVLRHEYHPGDVAVYLYEKGKRTSHGKTVKKTLGYRFAATSRTGKEMSYLTRLEQRVADSPFSNVEKMMNFPL